MWFIVLVLFNLVGHLSMSIVPCTPGGIPAEDDDELSANEDMKALLHKRIDFTLKVRFSDCSFLLIIRSNTLLVCLPSSAREFGASLRFRPWMRCPPTRFLDSYSGKSQLPGQRQQSSHQIRKAHHNRLSLV